MENNDRMELFIFMMRKHVRPESFYAVELYGRFLYIPLLEIIAFPLMIRFSSNISEIISMEMEII